MDSKERHCSVIVIAKGIVHAILHEGSNRFYVSPVQIYHANFDFLIRGHTQLL